jgi:hypothetical protein
MDNAVMKPAKPVQATYGWHDQSASAPADHGAFDFEEKPNRAGMRLGQAEIGGADQFHRIGFWQFDALEGQ